MFICVLTINRLVNLVFNVKTHFIKFSKILIVFKISNTSVLLSLVTSVDVLLCTPSAAQ